MVMPSRLVRCLAASLAFAALAATQRIPATTIAPAGTQTYPTIATTSAVTYVAWSDYVHVGLRRSTDGGGTWSAAIGVDRSYSCGASDVQLAVDGDTVYAAWTGAAQCGPFGPTEARIRFNRSIDRGASWLPSDVLVSGMPVVGSSYRATMAAVGSKVFVVWEDDRDGPPNVYFNRSLDSGTTWLPMPVRLDTDIPAAAISQRPRLAATGTTVCVTWMDHRHGAPNIYCNRSLDDGTTWLANDVRLDTGVAPGVAYATEPEITADGLSVCVVWRDARHWSPVSNQDADVYCNRSIDGGAVWLGSDVRVGPATTPGTIGCLEARTARNGNTVHVTWRDVRSGGWDVFAKRSLDGGATWLPTETRLNSGHAPGTAFALMPTVVATADVVAVVWLGVPVPGHPLDLFANRSTDGGASWLAAEVRLDTSVPAGTVSIFHALSAAGGTVRAAWVEGSSIVSNLPFGFVTRGTSMAGSGGFVPSLSGNGLPVIGSSFTVDLAGGLGGTLGVLLVGGGAGAVVSVPLFGGTLLVQPDTTLTALLSGASPGSGTWSLPITVPPAPPLVGLDLHCQMLLLDAAAASGFVFTNALEIWVD
jgi:hypothetical protein